MRAVLGVLGGLVAGVVAMMAIALVGGMLFPAPDTIDPSRPQEILNAFETLPEGGKWAILVSWFGAALVGAAVAKMIVRQAWAAWTIAILFALYVLASVFILPLPAWMQVVAVALPLIGGLIANHLVKSRASQDPEDAAAATDA